MSERPSDRSRLVRGVALGTAALGAWIASDSPPPGVQTLVLALVWGIAVARPRPLDRWPLRGAALAIAGLLVAQELTYRMMGSRGGLSLIWVGLVAAPLSYTFSPTRGSSGAILAFGAVAIGLFAALPLGPIPAACYAAAVAGLWHVLATEATVRRPALGARLQSLVLLTAAALLLTLSFAGLLSWLPSLLGPAEETEQYRPPPHSSLGSESLARELEPDRPVLRLRRVRGPALPSEIRLREFLLSEVRTSQGVAHLGRARGRTFVLRDGDDGRVDRKVQVQPYLSDPDLGAGLEESSDFVRRKVPNLLELSLEQSPQRRLLLPGHVRWIESEVLSIAPDGSIDRGSSSGAFTYRLEAWLEAPGIHEQSVVRAGSVHQELPARFDERNWLQRRVDHWLSPARSDREKITLLRERVLENVRTEAPAVFHGSFQELLRGECAGSSLHFAQAYALLARLAGIPARVVVGYVCWTEPEVDEYELYDRDRSAWAEVAIEGRGWIPVDLTPRWESAAEPGTDPETGADGSSRDRVADGSPESADGSRGAPEFEPAELGGGEELELDDSLEVRALPSVEEWPAGLRLGLLAGAALLVAGLVLGRRPADPRARRRRQDQPRWGRGSRDLRRTWKYWRRLLEVCRQVGFEKPLGWTPRRFADELDRQLPAGRQRAGELVDLYYACRYGERPLVAEDERWIRSWLRELGAQLSRSSRSRPQ